MYINELVLKNFRNYSTLEMEFSPKINFITGENGAGKTNIIEAISITSNIKSFRNIPDVEIIKWGENSYYCSSDILDCRYRKFEVGFSNQHDKVKKKIKIDNNIIKRSSEYFGKLLTVVFTPLDINIINGTPDARRRFFDSVISKIDLEYLDELTKFKKILKSRNSLLKSSREKKKNDPGQFEVWDKLFADKSSFITNRRAEFINNFTVMFESIYNSISLQAESPEIKYQPSIRQAGYENIVSELTRRRPRDIAAGTTGIGPQRDDYLLMHKDKNFTNYASQGQRRTAAISLKFTECDIIEKDTGEKCLILVDDIFSELDQKRRKNMIEVLKRDNQVIFTMVNMDYIDMSYFENSKKFLIDSSDNLKIIK